MTCAVIESEAKHLLPGHCRNPPVSDAMDLIESGQSVGQGKCGFPPAIDASENVKPRIAADGVQCYSALPFVGRGLIEEIGWIADRIAKPIILVGLPGGLRQAK